MKRAFNVATWHFLPACKEIVKIISASIDRKLTVRERFVMRLHLAACEPCVHYLEQSQLLSSAARTIDQHLKSDLYAGQLSNEAREQIRNMLKASAKLF
ncbi:MAG TPA: zf-HC2 domain-containing protein [Pyrinomonadaceae bacterium]